MTGLQRLATVHCRYPEARTTPISSKSRNETTYAQKYHLSRPPRPAVGRAVEGLRQLNLGRDQILNRLWELGTLSHEATRGGIAGQIKALSMILAIEGLIPDRRLSPRSSQPASSQARPNPSSRMG